MRGTLKVASSDYKIINILDYYLVAIKETHNGPATYIRWHSGQVILKNNVLIDEVDLTAVVVKSI